MSDIQPSMNFGHSKIVQFPNGSIFKMCLKCKLHVCIMSVVQNLDTFVWILDIQ